MITKDMTIGEVIKMKENAPEILMGFGMRRMSISTS